MNDYIFSLLIGTTSAIIDKMNAIPINVVSKTTKPTNAVINAPPIATSTTSKIALIASNPIPIPIQNRPVKNRFARTKRPPRITMAPPRAAKILKITRSNPSRGA